MLPAQVTKRLPPPRMHAAARLPFHGPPAPDQNRSHPVSPATATIFVFLPGKSTEMESTRQKKVARLIQKELAEIILHHAAELAPGKMISVTTVRVSPDLALAKTWVSIFPSDRAEETMTVLHAGVPKIRFELGRKVRNQLRIVPEIAFFLDDSNDYIDNITNLLKE